jgi:proton-coupled amino acid transporter
MGKNGRIAIDIMLILIQFSFTISQISFIIGTLLSVSQVWFNSFFDEPMIAIFVTLVLTRIAVVRKLHKFSFAFMLGSVLILLVCVITIGFCVDKMNKEGVSASFVPFHSESLFGVIGFSVYVFEGIGTLMPIMAAAEKPKDFPKVLLLAMFSLTCFYIIFGEVGYAAYADDMTNSIILLDLPNTNVFVQILRILYCVNLFCGYSLTIYPTNNILESYVLKTVKRSKARTWLKNIMRFIIVVLGVVSATILADKLDKLINILGALLCAPIAFIMPTLIHYNLVAKTRC